MSANIVPGEYKNVDVCCQAEKDDFFEEKSKHGDSA